MADGATAAAAILSLAKSFVGNRYVSGGAAPGGFDCSGLVQYVYGKMGIGLPRTTFDQIGRGINIPNNKAAPGDLVFFDETGADAPGPGGSPWGHVGIYLGNGLMVSASNPSTGVQITNVNGFSPVGRFTFRRVIPNYAGTGDTGVTTPGLSSLLSTSQGGAAGWDTSSIAASMGLSSSLFDSNPELSKVMQTAESEGLDPSTDVGRARFTALLQGTKWYRTKTDAQRKWELLSTSDPREAQQQFVSSLGNVVHTAASMGVSLSLHDEWGLALQNAQLAWTSDEMKYSIAAHFKANKTGMYGGDAGKLADDIRQQTQNYGMPVSAAGIGYSVFQILNGHATQQDYVNNAKKYAKSMFPALAADIDAGKTVRDAAQPYLQVYQNTLEQNPEQIDLTKDQTIRKALSYVPPDQITGQTPTKAGSPAEAKAAPQLMPLWQYEASLKDDPRWLKTDNAQKSLVGAGVGALKDLGLTAGA